MPTLKEVYAKLFTQEDNFNLHKSLGIFCLLHYAWRFAQSGPTDMGFAYSNATLGCIAAHLLLSVSSLIFKIPLKRIASGYRIWPEYRLHSIVFACRSLAMMLVIWAEGRFGLEPNHHLNYLVALGTIAAADLSSWSVGPAGRSSTIQDLEAPPAMRYFFSVMQFHATMGVMLGVRRFSTQFIYAWIIQLNAFLMTLRRKNLAPHSALVWTYGAMLVFGFIVCSYEAHTIGAFVMVNTLANTAAVLRLGGRTPKYLLWSSVAPAGGGSAASRGLEGCRGREGGVGGRQRMQRGGCCSLLMTCTSTCAVRRTGRHTERAERCERETRGGCV